MEKRSDGDRLVAMRRRLRQDGKRDAEAGSAIKGENRKVGTPSEPAFDEAA
jgi:hypothetical protein